MYGQGGKNVKENRDKAFDVLCGLEGYKSNMVGDRGGRTIWGITERYFPRDIAAMENMTMEESKTYARSLYAREFWDKHKLDDVPFPLDVISFCMIVNSVKEGDTLLHTCLADLHPTGEDWRNYIIAFQEFYKAIVRAGNKKCCVLKMCDQPKCQRKFEDGWFNRVFTLWHKFNG